MGLLILEGPELTNSFRPDAWELTSDPFVAFRGVGPSHRAFQPVGKEFDLLWPTKAILAGQKQTLLLVNCPSSEDEIIVLATVASGFRGGLGRWETDDAELLTEFGSNKHCVGVSHAVIRLKPEGRATIEARGRRCDKTLVVTATGLTVYETVEWQALAVIG